MGSYTAFSISLTTLVILTNGKDPRTPDFTGMPNPFSPCNLN